MVESKDIFLLSEVSNTPIELTVDQWSSLVGWDMFIEGLKIEKGFSWHDHWENLSRRDLEVRNEGLNSRR